jgi:hypothetical protein
MQKNWKRYAVSLGATALLALGACAGNDGETSVSKSAPASLEAMCDALVDADASEAELAAAVENAPEDVRADIEAMAAEDARGAVETGMTGGPTSAKFFSAATAVGDYMTDHCDYQVINVTATDDGFKGIPVDLASGRTLVRIRNDGNQFHEVALQKVRSDETRSIEELVSLPEKEGGAIFDYLGGAFAAPGYSSWTVVDLADGRYAALCYVPAGATPASIERGRHGSTSPSHAMKGMVAELHVT